MEQLYLAHHGVKGQKWGVRNFQNPDGSYKSGAEGRYSNSDYRKDIRSANKEYARARQNNPHGLGIGIKGLKKYEAAERKQKAAANIRDKKIVSAEMKKAQEAAKKSEKAEFKSYSKSMYKTGLPGSYKDQQSNGRSKKLYNEISKAKGKDYADKVMKSVQKKAVAQFAVGASLMLGSSIVSAYMAYK